MLVLSRKANETIAAGDLVIHVLSVGRGRVKLGIEAPAETRVLRGELLARPQPKRSPDGRTPPEPT